MPIERKGNLSEIAVNYLREQIMTGQLRTKEKIVEKEIADQLGMSRGPIREALQQLQFEGFVNYEANKGCTVTLLSPKDAYEIFYLRGSLEKLALERCGGHLLPESVLFMEEALETMHGLEAEEKTSQAVRADEMFHRQILLSGQMERLTKMWESLSKLNGAMFLTVRRTYQMEAALNQSSAEELANATPKPYDIHRRLFDVLVQGDLKKSQEAVDTHYQTTGERIYRLGMRFKNLSMFQGLSVEE